jgi:hypothetical protein
MWQNATLPSNVRDAFVNAALGDASDINALLEQELEPQPIQSALPKSTMGPQALTLVGQNAMFDGPALFHAPVITKQPRASTVAFLHQQSAEARFQRFEDEDESDAPDQSRRESNSVGVELQPIAKPAASTLNSHLPPVIASGSTAVELQPISKTSVSAQNSHLPPVIASISPVSEPHEVHMPAVIAQVPLITPPIEEPTVVEQSLPPVSTVTSLWQRYIDEASGVPYFYNSATGESSWEPPAEWQPESQPVPVAATSNAMPVFEETMPEPLPAVVLAVAQGNIEPQSSPTMAPEYQQPASQHDAYGTLVDDEDEPTEIIDDDDVPRNSKFSFFRSKFDKKR